MTSVLVLAGLWIVVGIPAIVAMLRERRTPDVDFARAMGALGTSAPPGTDPAPKARGGVRLDVERRRAQVVALLHGAGLLALAVGAASSSRPVLAIATVATNLGTVYRIVALRLSAVAAARARVRTPAPLPPAPAGHEPSDVTILGPVRAVPAPAPVPAAGDDAPGPAPDGDRVLVGQ